MVGYCSQDLEGRFAILRTEDTNLGNMIADVFRVRMGTDVAMIQGGALRSN